MFQIILVVFYFLALSACSVGGSSGSSVSGDGTSSSSNLSGTLTGTVAADTGVDPTTIANAKVEIESHPELSTTTDSQGKYALNNINPGSYTIYISSAVLGGATIKTNKSSIKELSASNYGVKISDVVVTQNQDTTVSEKKLKPTGSFTGTIDFFQNPNNIDKAGTDVYIPGTNFISKTDSNGNFALAGLPEGTYDLRMDHLGFQSFTLKGVSIISGQVTNIGSKFLDLSRGPQGGVIVDSTTINYVSTQTSGASLPIYKNRSVPLKISFNADAVWMKVSDESAFLNRQLETVASTKTWDFTTDGLKHIYVQFYDLNALPSSVYSIDFYVDTEAPTISKLSILNGWAQSAKQNVYIDTTATDTGSGIKEIIFSNTSSVFNTGESWINYNSQLSWVLSSGAGSKTVFAKVKDFVGNVSTVLSDSINLGDYTLVYLTTYNDKITFYKEQSPYLIVGNIIFNNDVEIKPGAIIYISQSSSQMTINGKVTAIGTNSDRITIAQAESGGSCDSMMDMQPTGNSLDLSQGAPGISQESIFEKVDFVLNNNLIVNGGTFTNNTFSAACTNTNNFGGYIKKTGLDNLVIDGNVFTKWYSVINVFEGSSNTLVKNNAGTIKHFFNQTGTGSGSILENNNFSSATGKIYSLSSGTFIKTNNLFGGSCNTYLDYNSSSNVSISETNSPNCGIAINKSGTGTLTASGLSTINSAKAIILSSGSLIISNSTFSNAVIGADISGTSSSLTVTSSSFTITEKLISTYSNIKATFSNNYLSCANATKYCDFLFTSDPANKTFDLTFTSNQIFCSGNSTPANNDFGCRGMAFQQSYTGAVTASLTLNFSNNVWKTTGGKTLNSDLANTAIVDFNSIINSQSVPPDRSSGEFSLFKFVADGATSITFSPVSIINTGNTTTP